MTTWFISRHPGAIAWAQQQGIAVDRQIAHLDIKDIHAGDTVIGTLPVNLAAEVCARQATFINLSLDIPEQWRGRELSAQELLQCKARLEEYQVARSMLANIDNAT